MHGGIRKIILTNKKDSKRMNFKNLKKIVYGIFLIIWMIIVFGFSNQNGKVSQSSSDRITNNIVQVCDDYFGISLKSHTTDISFIVRKLAHFSIYFLGGVLIYNFLNTFRLKRKYIIILSIVWGIIYAITDEMHQFFIDGRAAQIRDVIIDSCGVIIAILARNKLID